MLDVLFVLGVDVLFFLSLTATVAGFLVIVVELFRNKGAATEHHHDKNCLIC